MKTAISIPNPLFYSAEKLAERLGISRSELYSRAISYFVDMHRDDEITKQLNEIYAEEDSSIDPVLWQMQMNSLPKEEW
ncbi:ChpI protein [Chloroflexi bacterium TSY]|nr:ChpI protein [Chloroflexi bacterium TSY]